MRFTLFSSPAAQTGGSTVVWRHSLDTPPAPSSAESLRYTDRPTPARAAAAERVCCSAGERRIETVFRAIRNTVTRADARAYQPTSDVGAACHGVRVVASADSRTVEPTSPTPGMKCGAWLFHIGPSHQRAFTFPDVSRAAAPARA